MDTRAAVAPLDIGCGKLYPIRWSALCIVYRYDHAQTCAPNVVEDKPFEMNVLVQTTRGRWTYHGKRGVEEVDSGTVIVGNVGDRYGCRHDPAYGDSNLIATINSSALDGDEKLFSHETLALDAVREIGAAIRADTSAELDSRIFELFDRVSAASLRAGDRRRTGRVRFERMKRFIEENAFENVTLADIAESVGLTPFVCLRQFRARSGSTPHQYLNSIRLERAKTLLRGSATPVGEVGRHVGIADRCYFARWFSQHTGVSPSRFRSLAR
jgi:AraC-like DNA-binding protein